MEPEQIIPSEFANIQYRGQDGIMQSCLDAIFYFIYSNKTIEQANLITCGNRHSFLLSVVGEGEVAIKAGFSSGYSGTGPRGLSFALQVLQNHTNNLQEYAVSLAFFQRIQGSCLLKSDLEKISSLEPVCSSKIDQYISPYFSFLDGIKKIIKYNHPLVIPLGIIDERIMDLALQFHENPDNAIISAYRRLEDSIRQRTGISREIVGTKLFAQVFRAQKPLLSWEDITSGEQKGRASLFDGVYMSFRNRRGHRELQLKIEEEIREFLLINELFILESQAISNSENQSQEG